MAGDQFTRVIAEFLQGKEEFVEELTTSLYKENQPKTVEEARKTKNALRKKAYGRNATPDDRKAFRQAVRVHNYLKKQHAQRKEVKTTTYLETQYRKNFWSFASKCSDGTLNEQTKRPTFSQQTANLYYPSTYSVIHPMDIEQTRWFPYIPEPDGHFKPYNVNPIRPGDVKKILANKKATSAPGPDGLMYGLFNKLPATQHFMGTLFTKIMESGDPPETWSNSNVSLIYKSNSTDNPANFRMISLTCAVGKLYHQIQANRMTDFLLDNELIDPLYQKAFIHGINGCIEHTQMMHEVFGHAQSSKRTVHVTYFDLADAFGSVDHSLIVHTLKRNHVPSVIVKYVQNLYGRLQGKVYGQDWQSETFKFKRGVFQGDPWSPIIFILVFNPLIQHLKSLENTSGYDLNGISLTTLPFADDFCLITRNKATHQKIINDIIQKSKSMNLTLKPEKCRSKSIVSGRPQEVIFKLDDYGIKTVRDMPHKFLGSFITYSNTSTESYTMIKNKIEKVLDNINTTKVRNEYKVRVLNDYVLPSLRYLLSVHSLTDTQLAELDALQARHLKDWLNLPPCATLALMYSSQGLGFKEISQLYLECRTLSFATSYLKADYRVTHALISKEQREGQWKRKMKTFGIKTSKEIIDTTNTGTLTTTKKAIKTTLKDRTNKRWKEHLEPLVKQGNLLKLIADKDSGDLEWLAAKYSLPKGLLSFGARAILDVLPTQTNLLQWGKATSDKCTLCQGQETLLHILNFCPVALNQGRFTYRHNAIIRHLTNHMLHTAQQQKLSINTFADITGHTINGGTIPAQIITTTEKPDITLINKESKSITLIELTVPFETNITKARERKTERYSNLANDINNMTQWECQLICFEVGSRGLITRDNKTQIRKILKLVGDTKVKQMLKDLSTISTSASRAIFNARFSPTWVDMSEFL